jgi:hypothetical protein
MVVDPRIEVQVRWPMFPCKQLLTTVALWEKVPWCCNVL